MWKVFKIIYFSSHLDQNYSFKNNIFNIVHFYYAKNM